MQHKKSQPTKRISESGEDCTRIAVEAFGGST